VRLLEQAKNEGIESLIVTLPAIYGYAEHPFQLIKLICENSPSVEFQKVGLSIKIKKP
jgi:glutamyl-tRNA reductase